ncbi:MAG: hypothetical protein H0X39_05525 [Actinobacteria bacterium]|nr:hypothetical protein [Actinomycetota bacterium]
MGRGAAHLETSCSPRGAARSFLLDLKPDGHGAHDYELDEGEAYTLAIARPAEESQQLTALDRAEIDSQALRSANRSVLALTLLNVIEKEKLIHVRWIETLPSRRRQGMAADLLAEALRRWPSYSIDANGLTEYGEPLWKALEARGYPICWPNDGYYDQQTG